MYAPWGWTYDRNMYERFKCFKVNAATAPTQRNDANHWVFLNYNFSKEQCMLPEDERMIETCTSVLSVLMWILDL